MLKEDDVLLILHKDPWFRPSKSEKKKKILDDDGNEIEVAVSYYHEITNGGQILIRVSNHDTWLKTWLKRATDPSKSLQNLSVVFSDKPVKTDLLTEPVKITDKDGKTIYKHLYFVVEQYAYQMATLSKNDFLTFIKKLKTLGSDKVFKDPFKKKPTKRATRNVLTPQTMGREDIPPTNNPVHPRQTIVANNKDFEVDAEGNLIKEMNRYIERMIDESVRRALKERSMNESVGRSFRRVLREHLTRNR